LVQLRSQTGSVPDVFTADVNFARIARSRLGKNARVHLIDPQRPAAVLEKGLTVHSSLSAYLHPPPATRPAVK
jgi:hypothetical protein